jgi:hydrogenase-4 component E
MSPESVTHFIYFFGMLLLITSFGIIASPILLACIRFYAMHSFLLSLITLAIAYNHHAMHLVISALLTFILKVIAIPKIFSTIIRRLGIRKEVEIYINIPFSLLLAVGLVFVSFYVTSSAKALSPLSSFKFLPIAISTIFLGMLVMTTRKKALTQILGLLLMENGLFLMGITMTFGMPLLVELGILFDVLIGIIIMGIFIFKIRNAFEGIEVDHMTVLKG